jgi:hypothetical protein
MLRALPLALALSLLIWAVIIIGGWYLYIWIT